MRLPILSWKKTLSRLGLVAKNSRRGPLRTSRLPQIEPLEVRQLLTTVTVAAGVNASEGRQSGYYALSRDTTVGTLTVNYSFNSAGSTASYMEFLRQPERFVHDRYHGKHRDLRVRLQFAREQR
jgi:hypothetical protein